MSQSLSQKLQVKERQDTAYELSISGWTIQRIADEMNLSTQTIRKYLKKKLDEDIKDDLTVRQQRHLLSQELKEKASVWSERANMDEQALAAWLKIVDQQVKIDGLNAPQENTVSGIPRSININFTGMAPGAIIDGEYVEVEGEQSPMLDSPNDDTEQ